jgi:thiamine-phosphate pyrophosphorylase
MLADFGLYVITEKWQDRSHIDIARAAIAGGAKTIQLRDKSLPDLDFIEIAQQIQSLCRTAGVLFIVNDRADIAWAIGADGAHIGEQDMPPRMSRRLLDMPPFIPRPPGWPLRRPILGFSTANPDLARSAADAGCDYIAVGPIFPTGTKEDAGPAVGGEAIAAVKRACSLPIIAIGGIDASNLAEAIHAGTDSVAVVSAVSRAPDPEKAARELVEVLQACRRSA